MPTYSVRCESPGYVLFAKGRSLVLSGVFNKDKTWYASEVLVNDPEFHSSTVFNVPGSKVEVTGHDNSKYVYTIVATERA